MFGWLKGRQAQEREFFASLMSAAAEGQARDSINRALDSLNAEILPLDSSIDFSVQASSEFIKILSWSCGISLSKCNDDEAFVQRIFSMVASDYISQKIGAQFESVSAVAILNTFGIENRDELAEIIDKFNEMVLNDSNTINAIGSVIKIWFEQPTNENFSKIQSLFRFCVANVKSQY
ncbi:hypothetical protein L2D01_06065 [Hyphomonadaceae bacterium ML37]|nr:hypothetical protein L2D01_06065 [Hyphomonadaceae bacterium ML37]